MNAIILGTGADELGFNGYEKKLGSNHYGEYEYYQKDDIVIIPRHKMGHSVAPHLINYRANIHALKDLDVKNVVSIYAVGSISNKLLPSEFGIISDHVDFTHSRINTFFDGTFYPLDHVNAENQFSEKLRSCALALNKEIKRDVKIQEALPLDELVEHKSLAEEEIKKIDPMNTTPMEALNILYKLKEMIK